MRKLPIILFLLLLACIFPRVSSADLNSDVLITAVVAGDTPPPDGGTPGGTAPPNIPYAAPTDITFSGIAYPNAKVILFATSKEIAETKADSDALFSFKISSVTPGIKVFSIVAEDANSTRSILLTLPISILDKTSTTVSNLFIPPTLALSKNVYSRDESIVGSGYSAPGSEISLSVDVQNDILSKADKTGAYDFTIAAKPFSLGLHNIKPKSEIKKNSSAAVSGFGQIHSFFIALNGGENIPDKSYIGLVADLNGDGVVDIIDFSILASWYNKSNVPLKVDLNGDGKVTIQDFSIMAYYWNG